MFSATEVAFALIPGSAARGPSTCRAPWAIASDNGSVPGTDSWGGATGICPAAVFRILLAALSPSVSTCNASVMRLTGPFATARRKFAKSSRDAVERGGGDLEARRRARARGSCHAPRRLAPQRFPNLVLRRNSGSSIITPCPSGRVTNVNLCDRIWRAGSLLRVFAGGEHVLSAIERHQCGLCVTVRDGSVLVKDTKAP